MMRGLFLVCIIMLAGCAIAPQKEPDTPAVGAVTTELADEVKPEVKEELETKDSKFSRDLPEAYRSLVAARNRKDTVALTTAASKILAEKGDDLQALNLVAMYHYERRNYQLAKLILNRAFKKFPNSASLHANFGLVLLAEGEQREGMGYLEKARELDSNNFAANATLGSFYLQHYSFNKAAALLAKAHSEDRKDLEVANNYAIALRGLGKYDDARDIYERILDQGNSSEHVKVLFNYAVLLIDYMGKPEEGLKLVYKVNFIGPERGMAEELKVLEKKAKVAVK